MDILWIRITFPSFSRLQGDKKMLGKAIEKSLAELGKIYEVEKGDTIWDINKSQLDENEYWNSLTPRQQNFILDTMRHDLLNRSKSEIIDMGIKSGDINRIYPGDKIDFSKVFDKEELARIFSKAETKGGVSPASETHHAAPEIHQPTPTHTAPERLYPPQTIDSPRNDFIEYQVEKPLSEISMPETNSTDAFSLPAESIPSHYIEAVYEGIHEARPDIPQGFYDMKVADFLAAHPGGMKELDQIFHMDGVKTPSGLTAATENDRIVDYYARTVLQAETLHQEHASVIDIADQAHASQGSAPTAEMTANTAELSGFKTSFEKWSILPNEVKEYIATIDGQVGKNINHDVWEKLRTMPIKDVLGDPRNASVQARVEFLQRNADILNHPKLNIIEHETLEHYLARLARELTFRPNPPEIPKNM
ncbi:MAG: hypothetical protein HYT94_05520 [Parcubacteria group bacterium]|nr:hypothetical protein [Parcubacteria group bacterium]